MKEVITTLVLLACTVAICAAFIFIIRNAQDMPDDFEDHWPQEGGES
jgi:hypothetical protein